MALSIIIHVLLVIIAVIWVVSTVTDLSGKKDPNTFATGAGGGSGGPKAKEYKTKLQPKNVKALTKTNSRITSKNANASMAISSLPSMTNPLATAGAIGGLVLTERYLQPVADAGRYGALSRLRVDPIAIASTLTGRAGRHALLAFTF